MASRPPSIPRAASPRRPPQAKRAGSPASGGRDPRSLLLPNGEPAVSTAAAVATSLAVVTATAAASSPTALFTPAANSSGGGSSSSSSREGVNPQVKAIQSRVADLVRRYDESVAESAAANDDSDSDNDDADNGDRRFDVPVRWRVGDVLLATHSALAKTGTRMEQAIVADFDGDDPEVAEALGAGEQNFARVVHEAARRTQQMHQVLARTIAMVKQLQVSDEEQRRGGLHAASEQGAHVRELRTTLEALQKDKSTVLAQLQEQMRAHKELLVAVDEQHQELKRAQVAVSMKGDELRAKSDDFERRLGEAQRALDTSQQSASAWRDRFHGAAKSQLAMEQRVAELEAKVQAQAEEIVKHEVVLHAKTQEDKARDKLKDGEIQRLRAEVAAAAAAQAPADSKARTATQRSEGGEQQKAAAAFATEKQELLAKLQQAETAVLGLEAKLADELRLKRQFEDDNTELSRLVAEMKERARQTAGSARLSELAAAAGSGEDARLKKAASFAISLRALSQERGSTSASSGSGGGGGGSKSLSTSSDGDDDDLSTSSDDDDDDDDLETEREEDDLNATVQQVVASMFPQHRRALEQSDEHITRDIALFEDLQLSPLDSRGESRAVPILELLETPPSLSLSSLSSLPSSTPSTPTPLQAVAAATGAVPPSVPLNEAERMKHACDQELARMKTQYVAGLVEYKRLIVEQYERRQAQIHEQHRTEIENLIMLVQEKFRREVEKHGKKMVRAKESLKLLYRAMKDDGGAAFDRPRPSSGGGSSGSSGGGSSGSSGGSSGDGSGSEPGPSEGPVPLKSLLRAAVFAMSSSKKRASAASTEIKQIYETVKRQKEAGGGDFRAGRAAPTPPSPPVVEETHPRSPSAGVHASCPVCEADFGLLHFAKGFRGSSVAPQPMDGYVLSSSSLVGNQSSGLGRNQRQQQHSSMKKLRRHREGGSSSSSNRDGGYVVGDGFMLHLVEGAMFSDEIVDELREMLPALPAGVYYLSAALKQKLLLELLRFYAAWDARRCHLPTVGGGALDRGNSGGASGDVEIVIGSPRDTPFMRRKALESVEKQRVRQRRPVLAMGGEAIVSQPSGAAGMVAWPTPRSSPRVTL